MTLRSRSTVHLEFCTAAEESVVQWCGGSLLEGRHLLGRTVWLKGQTLQGTWLLEGAAALGCSLRTLRFCVPHSYTEQKRLQLLRSYWSLESTHGQGDLPGL